MQHAHPRARGRRIRTPPVTPSGSRTTPRYVGEELNFMPARMERLALCGVDARHRQARRAEPAAQQAREAHRRRVRARPHPREGLGADAEPHRLPAPDRRARRTATTRASTPTTSDHPIEPYIVMVADAYDAMTSTRAYRKALPQEVAFQELRDKAGIAVPPRVRRGADPRDREAARDARQGAREKNSHFEDAPEVGSGLGRSAAIS